MKIAATAISLNVPDVDASARFATTHLGFTEAMSADGFVSLQHPTSAELNLIFLRTGLPTFKPQRIAGSAGRGLLLVFVVDDLDAEYVRMAGPEPRSSRHRRPSRGGSASASSWTATGSSGSLCNGSSSLRDRCRQHPLPVA